MAKSKESKAPLEAAGLIAPAEEAKVGAKAEVKEAVKKVEDKKPVVEKIEDKKPAVEKIADKKPATPKIADKKPETKKIAEKVTAAEKKTAAKKTTAKKATEEKKTAAKETAAKKTATRRTAAKKEVNATLTLEFQGRGQNQEGLVEIAKDIWQYDLDQKPEDFKEVDFYVKLEESTVYYVINKSFSGKFTI